MGDYSRLREYIHDYFPEPIYDTSDVRDWARDNVPAWKVIGKSDKNAIIKDWEDFIAPQVESELESIRDSIGEKSPSFWGRIRKFLGRLFG
jgi:hypothetical protein